MRFGFWHFHTKPSPTIVSTCLLDFTQAFKSRWPCWPWPASIRSGLAWLAIGVLSLLLSYPWRPDLVLRVATARDYRRVANQLPIHEAPPSAMAPVLVPFETISSSVLLARAILKPHPATACPRCRLAHGCHVNWLCLSRIPLVATSVLSATKYQGASGRISPVSNRTGVVHLNARALHAFEAG